MTQEQIEQYEKLKSEINGLKIFAEAIDRNLTITVKSSINVGSYGGSGHTPQIIPAMESAAAVSANDITEIKRHIDNMIEQKTEKIKNL